MNHRIDAVLSGGLDGATSIVTHKQKLSKGFEYVCGLRLKKEVKM